MLNQSITGKNIVQILWSYVLTQLVTLNSTISKAILNYQPITNMPLYQNVANIATYATQSWVTSQNYLTTTLNLLALLGGTLMDELF